jgi:MYXO-CTERM domain-containing protein
VGTLSIERAAWRARILAAAAVVAAGCTDGASSPSPAPGGPALPPATSAARERLRAIREQFPNAIDPSAADRFEATTDGLHAVTGARGALSIDLPRDAAGVARVSDPASGVAVTFALQGAVPVSAMLVDGFVFYPAAAPSGGDVIHRVGPTGTEDFITFARAPEASSLRYRVDVRQVAGLRLVEDTLEMLDGGGAPRLRVAPPFVIDAAGRRVRATLAIEGCAVDHSPRAPWGQPVTRPGADACTVVVSWAERDVRYPALVDPAWMATGLLAGRRALHAVAPVITTPGQPCKASPVLIAGGVDASGAVLSSAELYEPLSRTFAATASMIKPRAGHTATTVPATLTGYVLIAGGAGLLVDPQPPEKLSITNLTDSATTELYDAKNGVFVLGPSMSQPRFYHTATALPIPDGRILLAGGIVDQVNQPTKSADLFSFNLAQPSTSTIQPSAAPMQSARSGHAAAVLPTGDVLVTGGIGSAFFAQLTSEIFCAGPACSAAALDHFSFTSSQLSVPRAFHSATTLASGDVLVAGGVNAIKNPGNPNAPITYANNADLFTGGAFVPTQSMTSARAFHTATQLVPPMLVLVGSATEPAEVIVAGGFDGSSDLLTTEGYFPASKSFHPLNSASPGSADLTTPRRHAAGLLVNAGDSTKGGCGVLVTGGIAGSTTTGGTFTNGAATRTAELLLKNLGEPCTSAAECLSGFCADGVCCDTNCVQECWSCTAAKKQDLSADGTCGHTVAGTPAGIHCFDDLATKDHVEVHDECDGQGQTHSGPGTHSCLPASCGTDGLCSKVCSATVACAVSGWCDLTTPPDADAGIPDAGGPFGSCKDKKIIGAACLAAVECSDKACIDGYCCDSPCDAQCQACDVTGSIGKCVRLGEVEAQSQPHPDTGGSITTDAGDAPVSPRPLCNGQGTACQGWCGPMDVNACTYPGAAIPLHAAACTDTDGGPSTIIAFPCDSDGGSTQDAGDCRGFRCEADATTCKTTCALDAGDVDCIQDNICDIGDAGAPECVQLVGKRCDGHDIIRVVMAEGGPHKCANHYACPADAGDCLQSCNSIDDCVDGYICDRTQKCVKTIAPPELSSCAATPANHPNRGAWSVGLLALLALAARRRRS